ncbi:MAG: phosphatidylcholine/phosphatidylserine synthase [Xanthomonadales bacterium]|nr:phosphatidylcholine/phosphatidylserine synthase [Xanthomonadales bacterium]
MSESPTVPARHPGIYLLPNLFTTAGMMAGFFAIISAFNGRFTEAAIAVFVAGLLDGVDGRVARMTNTQSDFGVQYDSLADLVSFGVAPAVVMYAWALASLKGYGPVLGKVGWAAAFVYTACAAMRLARFNTQIGVIDKRYFQGLASPASAGLMMSFVWTMNDHAIPGTRVAFLALFVTLVAAILMVSRLRYWSFKAKPESERVPFIWIPLALGIIVALVIDPPRLLLAICVLYVAHGPLLTLWGMRKRRERPAAP